MATLTQSEIDAILKSEADHECPGVGERMQREGAVHHGIELRFAVKAIDAGKRLRAAAPARDPKADGLQRIGRPPGQGAVGVERRRALRAQWQNKAHKQRDMTEGDGRR